MIKHVVFFKFKSAAGDQERKRALDGLRALPGKIEAIRSYEVAENIVDSPRAWDAVLIGEYDDLAALEIYAKHDAHVAAAVRLKDICENVGTVDYKF